MKRHRRSNSSGIWRRVRAESSRGATSDRPSDEAFDCRWPARGLPDQCRICPDPSSWFQLAKVRLTNFRSGRTLMIPAKVVYRSLRRRWTLSLLSPVILAVWLTKVPVVSIDLQRRQGRWTTWFSKPPRCRNRSWKKFAGSALRTNLFVLNAWQRRQKLVVHDDLGLPLCQTCSHALHLNHRSLLRLLISGRRKGNGSSHKGQSGSSLLSGIDGASGLGCTRRRVYARHLPAG